MLVAEGTVRAVQSNFTGASVPGAARPGGLVAGVLHASNCGFMGGDMFLSAPEAPGVQTLAGATVWLADCTVRPGAGFHLVPSIAGPGVSTASRCVGAAGAPLPGPATGLGVTRNGPPQLGRTFIANYRTGPATPVGLHLSFALGDVAVPEILQPWSAPLGASSSLGFAFTDAAGLAGFGWSIPNALVLAGMPIWVHSFGGLSFPLESAPPVGGRLR